MVDGGTFDGADRGYIGRAARAIDKGAVARCSIRAAARSMPSVASRLRFSIRVQQAGHRLADCQRELTWQGVTDARTSAYGERQFISFRTKV